MTNKHHRRRGMTLAEIMICIAVVAISVVMVTSFSVTMGTRMSQSKAQLEAREELEALEELTDAWLNAVLKDGAAFDYTLEVPETWPEAITATVAEQALTLDWQYNRLIGARPGTDAEGNPVPPIVFRTEHVTDMRFFVKPETEFVDKIDDEGNVVYVQKTDENGNLVFNGDGTPKYVQEIGPDGEPMFEADGETPIYKIEKEEKLVEGGDMLFYCKVTFEIPMGNAKQPIEQTHIFCINPHMGDTVN